MKKLWLLLILLLSTGALLTACGGDSEEPLDQETIAAAADEVCAETNSVYDDFGVRGATNAGLALEFEATARGREQFVEEFEALDVEDSVTDWDRYVEVTGELVETDRAIASAAAEDDTEAVNAAFGDQSKLFDERDELSKKLGFEVCGRAPDLEVVETGTGPDEDVNFAEPKNTVQEAADEYLAVAISGNCKELNALRHTDAGTLDESACATTAAALKGGEVAGTEQFGPVGIAEIVGAVDVHYPTFFVTDLDGNLRYAADTIHDSGGLRPAPEGNDADETADAMIAAIREGDSAAFNATVNDIDNNAFKTDEDGFDTIGNGKFAEKFIGDIRDTDVEAVPLGITSSYAFYLVEGSEYDWVVNLIHVPGDQDQYRLSGYFPIPRAE